MAAPPEAGALRAHSGAPPDKLSRVFGGAQEAIGWHRRTEREDLDADGEATGGVADWRPPQTQAAACVLPMEPTRTRVPLEATHAAPATRMCSLIASIFAAGVVAGGATATVLMVLVRGCN